MKMRFTPAWGMRHEESYISVLPEIMFKVVVLGCGAGDAFQHHSQGILL